MMYSFGFIFVFFCFVIGALLYPQTDRELYVVQALPIRMTGTLCVMTMGVFAMQRLGITIDIKSSSLFLIFANCAIWYGIVKKKKVQKLRWTWLDVLLLLLPSMLVLWEAYHMFSSSMNLSFLNDDAQSHFRWAMDIVRSGKVSGTFFNSYLNAMLIETAAPWLPPVQYYKAFTVGNVLMHLLEVWLFYAVFSVLCRKKTTYYLFPIIAILYFLGYPTFSFMRGNFVYWSTGGTLFLFLIYILLNIEKEWKNRRNYYLYLLLGISASIFCNRLYAVTNTLSVVLIYIILKVSKKSKDVSKKAITTMVSGSAALFLLFFSFREKVVDVLRIVCESLSIKGYTYTSFYKQFILFVPVVIVIFVKVYWKKKRSPLVCNLMVFMVFVAAGMYWLYLKEVVSAYYYYKIYYTLWILVWLLTAMTIDILLEECNLVWGGIYGIFLLCLAFSNICGLNAEFEWKDKKDYFDLYENNFQYFMTDYESAELASVGRYNPPERLEAYQYIWNHYGDRAIWFITDSGNYMMGRWFAAITGQVEVVLYEQFEYYVEWYLKAEDIYLIVAKESGVYEEVSHLFNEENIVYEDTELVVVKSALAE